MAATVNTSAWVQCEARTQGETLRVNWAGSFAGGRALVFLVLAGWVVAVAPRAQGGGVPSDGRVIDHPGMSESSATQSGTVDLSFVVSAGPYPNSQCFDEGAEVTVKIAVGPTEEVVVGGQFLVSYDPNCLMFLSASPGQACDPVSPLSVTVNLQLDASAGRVFHAVAVNPFDDGVQGPVTLSCLRFLKLVDCGPCELCFLSENPQNTRLTNPTGQEIPFTPHCSGPIRGAGALSTSCPADVEAHAECNRASEEFAWNPSVLTDSCLGALAPSCTGSHTSGVDVSGMAMTGGLLPIGLATFCCEAESVCGQPVQCCWSVNLLEAEDSQCDDGDACTVDICDPNTSGAGPDGCLHNRLVILHCDIAPPGGDQAVDSDDILCAMDEFSNPGTCLSADVVPCGGGDGVVDVDDVLGVLSGFLGESPCPDPCPR